MGWRAYGIADVMMRCELDGVESRILIDLLPYFTGTLEILTEHDIYLPTLIRFVLNHNPNLSNNPKPTISLSTNPKPTLSLSLTRTPSLTWQ